MVDTKTRTTALVDDFEIFKKSFGLPQKEEELISLTERSLDPDLWNDQNKAKKVMQDLSDLKNELDEVKNLDEEIKIINELSSSQDEDLENEINKIEARLNKIKLKTFLSSLNDKKDATLSIHAGQGRT